MPAALLLRLAPYVAILAAALALFGVGYFKGHSAAMDAWRATEAKAENVALQATLTMERKGAVEAVRYVQKVKVIHDQIETIKTVTTPADDARCDLPAGFVSMWNDINKASSAKAKPGIDAAADPAVVAGAQAGGR